MKLLPFVILVCFVGALLTGCAGYDVNLSLSGEYRVPGAKEPIRVSIGTHRLIMESGKDAKGVQPVQ